MAKPRVLDAEGREIVLRSQVELVKRVSDERPLVGKAAVLTIDLSGDEPHVGVGAAGIWFTTRSPQPTADPGVYTCPDLLLHDDKDKEAADSCPERSSE